MMDNQDIDKKHQQRQDKAYRTTCAVYKLMKRYAIKKDVAIEYLHKRANMNKRLATAVVEMWMRDPLKHIYGKENK